MNDKKSNFLLSTSQREVFNALSDEEAGKLIKGAFDYVETGNSGLSGYLAIVFIPIKNDIDKNEENYKKRCEINKSNGSKGGAPKGNKNATKSKTTENNQKQPKTTKNNMNNHNHIHTHNSVLGKDKGVIGEEEKPFKEIIEHLNKRTGSNFKYTTNSTQQKIIARLNEGYNLDDFIVVIDKKCVEWMNTEMEKYLRPETLFGTKFESYLNQRVKKRTTKGILTAEDIANF